jgi:hypothetical protein
MTASPFTQENDPGTPGVIARPPLLLLGALLLGFGLDHLASLPAAEDQSCRNPTKLPTTPS